MDDTSDIAPAESEAPLRDRAIGLFNFLYDFCRLRTKLVYSLDRYEKVLWLDDIPREPGCSCAAWIRSSSEETKESETWLTINKPRIPVPPKLPEVLSGWASQASVEDSSQEMPTLLSQHIVERQHEGEAEETITEVIHLSDHPEVSAAWDDYILQQWWPWAEIDRRLKKVQQVYTELFSMFQKQQRLGEQYEVILGQGLLTMPPDHSTEVKRHLLVSKALLDFNRTNGTITLGAASEGAGTCLETEMVDPQFLPEAVLQSALEQQASEIAEAVWDPTQVDAVLQGWINSASSEGSYEPTIKPQMSIAAKPTVNLAPAIVLRARTERFLLKFFEGVLTNLRSGSKLPAGIRKFVAEAERISRGADLISGTENHGYASEGEVYFPLPANAEQCQIVNRLAAQQGVVVQGPPGTGKSHTIVNLICDLLAKEQRVLVTSHTARALQVLRKFISTRLDEISPLCVLLLGNDRNALQSMEDSVQGITIRHNNRDEQRSRRTIVELEQELAQAREKEARLSIELRQIRQSDTYRHPSIFSLYEGTLQNIAQQARKDANLYDWLQDQPGEGAKAPLSNEEALELLNLVRQDDLETRAIPGLTGIETALLLNPPIVEELFQNERDALKVFKSRGMDHSHPDYPIIRKLSSAVRSKLTKHLTDLLRDYEGVSRHAHGWAKKAAIEILGDRDRPWRELLRLTREHLRAIGDKADRIDRVEVSGLSGRDLNIVKSHATDLILHFKDGGGLGIGIFRRAAVKQGQYLIESVYLNGRLCNSKLALEALVEWIDVGQHYSALDRLWAPHARTSSPTLSGRKAEYEDMCEPLEMAIDLHRHVTELKEFHRSLEGLSEPVWHDADNLRSLERAAQAVETELSLDAVRKQVEGFLEPIAAVVKMGNCLPLLRRMSEAISTRDGDGYRAAYNELVAVNSARAAWDRREELVRQLKASAPHLCESLVREHGDSAWAMRFTRCEQAWNWRRILRWVARMSDYDHLRQIMISLDECRCDIQRILKELAATKAWEWCFTRMTTEQAEHLVAWSHAVRRIGKGTGTQAPRHRRAAQEHLDKCRGAIPAWIMPVYRVAETTRPEPDIFDVAIIDEASQSGPEALLLLYLAKKIVVVGDDKQISPEFVGIQRDDVNLLRERHLADLPHRDSYGVEESFFALAEIRYQGRIRLREHFRCMPEIIQFSNNLSYQHEPLIPLKQYGSGRLKPVVQSVHVAGGYRKGQTQNVINPPEAQAVVDRVLEIFNDQAYEDKTIGIISLQGDRQAQYIETLLMDQLGPDRMASREIVCGDAYAFQGDERDIVLLSLVAAPDPVHRIGTLSGLKAEQRFNVAASRAREQMFLFHTATLSDLSPQCVRYRLLEYCQNPKVEALKIGELDLDNLRELAVRAERDRMRPPPPFDSWFEVDVFLKISDRGYRVIPQFEVAGYSIDLVVDGMKGRLGVECDGDQWHGPDRYEADMARQRVLERCGWTIERLRGGAFYLDPDAALASLWQKLGRLEVYPESRGEVPVAAANAAINPGNAAIEPLLSLGGGVLLAEDHRYKEESSARSAPEADRRVVDLSQWRQSDQKTPSLWPSRRNHETAATSPEPEVESEKSKSTDPCTHAAQEPYRNWIPIPVPDPRKSGSGELVSYLVSIVEVEGPMLGDRAYHLFAQAAGIHRLREGARVTLDKALRFAVRRGLLLQRSEHRSEQPSDWIIRTPDTPFIRLRKSGGRDFGEIPPSELAVLMKMLLNENNALGREELFRRVLACYDVRRMTHGIEETLVGILRDIDKLTSPESIMDPNATQ